MFVCINRLIKDGPVILSECAQILSET